MKIGSDKNHTKWCQRAAHGFVRAVKESAGTGIGLISRDVRVALVMDKVVGCIAAQEMEELPVWRFQELIRATMEACDAEWRTS